MNGYEMSLLYNPAVYDLTSILNYFQFVSISLPYWTERQLPGQVTVSRQNLPLSRCRNLFICVQLHDVVAHL